MANNTIGITVRNRLAEGDGCRIVCGNSGYIVSFSFDGEWTAHQTKTMRVAAGGETIDVTFSGTTAELPALPGCLSVRIGVMAGGMASTFAIFPCIPSAADAHFTVPDTDGQEGGGSQ